MFFGLTNALTTCQKLFNQIFKTALDNFVIMYFDNISIYLKIKKNIKHIYYIFQKLKKHDLKIELKNIHSIETK